MRKCLTTSITILSSIFFLATFHACNDESNQQPDANGGTGAASGTGGGHGGSNGGAGGLAGYGGYGGSEVETPSGYLLLPQKRLDTINNLVSHGDETWKTLKSNVDENLGSHDPYESSPENVALVYLLTKDAKYAQAAYEWEEELMSSEDVTADSYLYFGDLMRHAALVLNWCSDALDADQKSKLIDYLEHWTDILWTDNADGWGMDDPGNNYLAAFLEGTSFAGYALKKEGRPKGQQYIDKFLSRMNEKGGVVDYMNSTVKGGDWLEGENYGQRSKQRLYDALSVAASMGGPIYFQQIPFFDDALRTIYYRLQPGWTVHDPWGDLSADSAMPVTPFDRQVVQIATFWSKQPDARARGAWFMNNIVDDYTGPVFDLSRAYYLDVLYGEPSDVSPKSPNDLPLSIEMPGTHWINVRTSWKDDATSFTVSAPPVIEQSHQHIDVGSFVVWKKGWQAVDAITYSDQGCTWGSDAHNMIHVQEEEQRGGDVVGVTKFEDTAQYAYVQVDGTGQYRKQGDTGDTEQLLDEYTRELLFLKPNTVITYDRVKPNGSNRSYDFRFHFAKQPEQQGGRFFATNDGGGVSLRLLAGGDLSIHRDSDIVCGGSESWRVQTSPTGASSSRYLSIVSVGLGGAPELESEHIESDGDLEGLLWNDHVIMFSSSSHGAAPTLPVHYTVPSTSSSLTYWLIDMDSDIEITTQVKGGKTEVTVEAGSQLKPTTAGVVLYEP